MVDKLSVDEQRILADNLKYFRKKKKITFEELAKRVNMSGTVLKNIEYSNRNNTSYGDVELLAKALDISVNELLNPVDNIQDDYVDFDNYTHFQILNPNVDIKMYHIISLFQFLVYLPLIPPYFIYSIVSRYDVIYNREKSILSYIDALCRGIYNKKAKKYADFLYRRLTYSGLKESLSSENVIKDAINGFPKNMVEYNIYRDCNEFFDSLEDYLECKNEYEEELMKQVKKSKGE